MPLAGRVRASLAAAGTIREPPSFTRLSHNLWRPWRCWSILIPRSYWQKYVLIGVEFDQALVRPVDLTALPRHWRSDPPPPEVRAVGDEWILAGSSPVLQVPSALVPGESNFLLNPAHEDFPKLRFGKPLDVSVRSSIGRPPVSSGVGRLALEVWGGHSCPPPLTLFLTWTSGLWPMTQKSSCGQTQVTIQSKTNFKGVGQECPTHTNRPTNETSYLLMSCLASRRLAKACNGCFWPSGAPATAAFISFAALAKSPCAEYMRDKPTCTIHWSGFFLALSR